MNDLNFGGIRGIVMSVGAAHFLYIAMEVSDV